MTRSAAAALLLLVAASAGGQEPTQRPPSDTARRPLPQRDTSVAPQAPGDPRFTRIPGAPGDTARDTLPRELVTWPEPDSLMRELLQLPGHVVTRYKADSVVFQVPGRIIRLEGDAAVERQGSIIVGDTIIYNDSSRIVTVFGDTIILRDPAQPDDYVALGQLTYDLVLRRGVATRIRTTVESGERWYVFAHRGATLLEDEELGQPSAIYGRDGMITSCDLTEPHYHFRARDVKAVSRHIMVARPAVLYISDIPVMWLPFVFQDLRSGRRSGMLSPRLGVSDIVRNNPSYRRHVENLGYYWAISDYMDAQVWMDWRSGARPQPGDPGFRRYNLQWQYNWLNRFLRGGIAASHERLNTGDTNLRLSWQHSQSFSQDRRLTANVNYSSNTRVQRQVEFNPFAAVATMSSSISYSQSLGPASIQIGGTRTQYVGRDDVNQTLPTVSISTAPLSLAERLIWTPSFRLTNTQTLNQPPVGALGFRFVPRPDGVIDSVGVTRDSRTTTMSLDSPLEIFDFRFRNSFSYSDRLEDYPQTRVIYIDGDTARPSTRVFERTFLTEVNWETGFSLPRFSQGRWNLAPSVSFVNVDPAGFWVRSERTGGQFVNQTKRPRFSLGVTPTLFGLFPGFGPIARFRHALSPTLSYGYSPAGRVSDEFLAALGRTRAGYLGELPRSDITLGLNQVIEARLRSESDTTPDAGRKVKVLSLNFSSVSYDFIRAQRTGQGWATPNFSYSARSDLLPGFDFRVDYSLFEGNLLSDTARFSPYRTGVSASFSLTPESNPFVLLARLFGKAVPAQPGPRTDQDGEIDPDEAEMGALPIPGQPPGSAMVQVPRPQGGWSADLVFTATRQRPIRGDVILLDPFAECDEILNEIVRQQCIEQRMSELPVDDEESRTTFGGPVIRLPPRQSLQSNVAFNLTTNWSARWTTTYDLIENAFASHIVSLQRDLHDWRAVFAFTQAPNGNFAFNFFIALKAQPDIKFDYNRHTYRPPR